MLANNHIVSGHARERGGVPGGCQKVTQMKRFSAYLEMPQFAMNEGTDWLRYRVLHLLGRGKQSIPKTLRSFTTHPHSHQRIVMIDNRLGDDQGLCGVR